MLKQLISKHLSSLNQTHLLYGLETLEENQLKAFWQQVQRLDHTLLTEQQELLAKGRPVLPYDYIPLKDPNTVGSESRKRVGCELISQGKVGCIILAGGQGSRLNWYGPKGTFPICKYTKKSLFQKICEKIRKKQQSGQLLQIAIMTSQSNHKETEKFFEKNHFFGLLPSQVFFFSQESLPFLDERGNWCLESPGRIAEGPNGNGDLLECFFSSSIASLWQNLQIEYIHVVPIDNPLADPLDPELTGYLVESKLDVALKVVQREFYQENMGVIAQKEKGIRVIEYSEISIEERKQFLFCNVNVFCFSLRSLQNLFSLIKLPLHIAKKRNTVFLCDQGKQISCFIWKYEKFIFDVLEYLPRSSSLLYPRSLTYAPLKELADVQNVQKALAAYENLEI